MVNSPTPELQTAVRRTRTRPGPPPRLPSFLPHFMDNLSTRALGGVRSRPAQNPSPRGAPGGSEPLPSTLPVYFGGQGSNGHRPEPPCADTAHGALFCDLSRAQKPAGHTDHESRAQASPERGVASLPCSPGACQLLQVQPCK